MKHFDYVMAGGGMAALSLAYHILRKQTGAQILIIDPEEKGENDKTWSFWTDGTVPLEDLASGTWSTIHFAGSEWSADIPLERFAYKSIDSIDFYNHVLDELHQKDVTFIKGRVVEIRDGASSATVVTEDASYEGTWVFDSRFDPQEYSERTGPHHYLKQHFLGWTIETEKPAFRSDVATLFDFRVPSDRDFRFGYLLPKSEKRSLIEYTLFTADLLEDEQYVRDLEYYIKSVLGISDFRVVDREKGVIPMTDEPVERRAGARTLLIGTRGGMVKASTGYAFARTQRDSVAITESLSAHGDPFHIPHAPSRYALLDTMMLQVMYRRGELSELVFTRLFRDNPIDRLFRFLDEQVSVPEMLAVMSTVPWGPFIKAFYRTKIKGTI
jgi:lycopene beta-cyclase